MYVYDSKKWFSFKFFLSKADTLRTIWPFLLLIFAYSILVVYLEINFLQLSEREQLKNINLLHSMLGFVISLLIVFRTNTAYDRWWEARKQWGALTNCSRNLAIKMSSFLPEDASEERQFFKTYIPLYAETLKFHLREASTKYVLDEVAHPELAASLQGHHLPNNVAKILYQKVVELYRVGMLKEAEMIHLQENLSTLTDICGACERIRNTPIPYSYSSFIKRFITVYIITLPIGYVTQLGYMVAPLTTFIAYVLGTLELIAEEIEEPFGSDPNDLPIHKMVDNIKKHVEELF